MVKFGVKGLLFFSMHLEMHGFSYFGRRKCLAHDGKPRESACVRVRRHVSWQDGLPAALLLHQDAVKMGVRLEPKVGWTRCGHGFWTVNSFVTANMGFFSSWFGLFFLVLLA